MTCPQPLARSMYADGELSASDAAEIERHVAGCAACSALVAGLITERRALANVLQHDDELAHVPEWVAPAERNSPAHAGAVPRPADSGRASSGSAAPPWRRFVGGAAALAALAAGPLAVWSAVAGFDAPAAIAWLNPLSAARLAELALGLTIVLISEGASMMTTTVETSAAAMAAAVLLWGLYTTIRVRPGTAALLAAALAAVVLPFSSQALEVRRSEGVLTVPADETIDDTLIALGDSIEIDGTVTGDLIAFGRRVNVRGTVQGQLVTGARSVNVEGGVGGSVLGFAETLSFAEATIGRNLFGFGRDVSTSGNARIDGNAVVFASTGTLAGPVGIDVMSFANELALSGDVAGDFTAYAASVSLLAPASVGGDVVAHVSNEDALQVSPQATVGGMVRTEVREPGEGPGPAAEPGLGSFYAWQAVRFGAAFLTGLIVLALATTLRRATPGTTGMEMLTTAGIGLVAMVAVPIIAVLAAITLIGLPVALLAFLLWGAALYFAKILFAHFLGRTLFERAGRPAHFALSLAVGLLIVLIVTSVPLIGGVVGFVLTITGLGMLLIHVWGRFQGRRFGEPAPDAAYS